MPALEPALSSANSISPAASPPSLLPHPRAASSSSFLYRAFSRRALPQPPPRHRRYSLDHPPDYPPGLQEEEGQALRAARPTETTPLLASPPSLLPRPYLSTPSFSTQSLSPSATPSTNTSYPYSNPSSATTATNLPSTVSSLSDRSTGYPPASYGSAAEEGSPADVKKRAAAAELALQLMAALGPSSGGQSSQDAVDAVSERLVALYKRPPWTRLRCSPSPSLAGTLLLLLACLLLAYALAALQLLS